MIRPTLAAWERLAEVAEWVFSSNGLTEKGAVVLFILIAAITLFWSLKGEAVQTGFKTLPGKGQKVIRWAGIAVLIIDPPRVASGSRSLPE